MQAAIPFVATVFAAGVAIQQGLEVADAWFSWRVYAAHKKVVLKTAAFALGWFVVYAAPLELPGFSDSPAAAWWRYGIGALLIGAAAEVANSVIKLLVYLKESRKAAAAQSAGAAGTLNLVEIGQK